MSQATRDERRGTDFEPRAAIAEVLLILGALAVLQAWHSMVNEIAPSTWIEIGDGSVEVIGPLRLLGVVVIPAVVLGLAGWLLVRPGSRLRRAGAALGLLAIAHPATVLGQRLDGPAGIAAALLVAVLLVLALGRRAGLTIRATVTATVAVVMTAVLAIALVFAAWIAFQAIGYGLLGDVYQSTAHHSAIASVPYTVLKLVGWLLIAGLLAAAAARNPGRTAAASLRVVVGVALAVAAGDAAFGRVFAISLFEQSPLEPWLGLALVAATAAALVVLALRQRTSAYLVGAAIAIADGVLGIRPVDGGITGSGLAVAGAVMVAVGIVLWRSVPAEGLTGQSGAGPSAP